MSSAHAKSFGSLEPVGLLVQREAEKSMFTAHMKQTRAQTTKLIWNTNANAGKVKRVLIH